VRRLIVVVIATGAGPLVGSAKPLPLERFCGEPLVDRARALVASAFDEVDVHLAGPRALPASAHASFLQTNATDLLGVLRALEGKVAPDVVALAIDPCFPLLSVDTLRALVTRATAGAVVAVGPSATEQAAIARPPGAAIDAGLNIEPAADHEVRAVRSKRDLVEIEREAYLDRAHALLAAGLLVRDPVTTRIDGPLSFGVDVEIEPDCTLRGPITLGDRVRVGRGSILVRATIGDDTEVRPMTMIEDASIGPRGFVGPYARVRPGTSIGGQAQIGNFVEIKASRLGDGNRINHMTFVGDATIGDQVTLGAGTITCNHDGTGMQPTTIGPGAYVGSGCTLVAPLVVGDGATIGAGSTITKDAPPSKLTLARTRQVVVEGWRMLDAKRK
jgi:bifunctional N-acetylglucosamine-1-phosphate-uridyltransferase/glucosamine-1-phosphate-acetyltransferase GlmU-like protein